MQIVVEEVPEEQSYCDESSALRAPALSSARLLAGSSRPSWLAGRSLKFAYLLLAAIAAVGLVLAVAGRSYWRSRQFRYDSKDTILLGDFDNRTSEPAFTGALRQGLFVALEQSPYLQIVSDRKTDEILQQMGRPADEKLVGSIATEVCLRTHAKVAVEGTVSQIGASYVLGLTAIRCDTGAPFLHEQATAEKKEDVLGVLDRTSVHLRTRLGESLDSIQAHQVQLEEASTASLAALEAYSQAMDQWNRNGEGVAIPLLQRAVQLDGNFAVAYGMLAAAYENVGRTQEATENATKAYQLRGRVGELERIYIESWYEIYVTRNLERAAEISEVALRTYPRSPRLLNDLGSIECHLGHYRRAVDLFRMADQLMPSETIKSNLAFSLMEAGENDEAERVLKETLAAGYSSDWLVEVDYLRAFQRGDRQHMQMRVTDAVNTRIGALGLQCEQAQTEAYYGRFRAARQLLRSAIAADHGNSRDDEANCLALQAVAEAQAGELAAARAEIRQALALSGEEDVRTLAALVFSETGDAPSALATAEELALAHPAGTYAQHYWIPLIRSSVELKAGHPDRAITWLNDAESLDSAEPDYFPKLMLLPVFLRARARLAGGDAAGAVQQYDKLLEHPGLVLNDPLGALAIRERARAYAKLGDTDKARAGYGEFLTLWKDADVDLPFLQSAKTEFAGLH
jgi:tetratricopeptide (TPR) repeat protein